MDVRLSSLEKTWIIDLDGTIVRHNGHLHEGDELLDGVKDFIDKAYEMGRVIILTARKEEYRGITIDFLKKSGIKYHNILFDIPYGERVLINDKKPSGLNTAVAVNLERDKGIDINIIIDEDL